MTLEILQYFSIIIEAIVAIIGLLIYIQKKKVLGIGIFVTFAIYVFYDSIKLQGIQISSDILYTMFFVATISALYFTYKIFKMKGK